MNTDAPDLSAPQSADEQQPITAVTPTDEVPLWDAVQDLYNTMLALSTAPGQVHELLRARDLVALLPDPKSLLNNSTILANDVVEYNNRLSAIYNKHAGRTGEATDPDDQMAAMQIFQEYVMWEESYRMVVIPMIQTITDTFTALVNVGQAAASSEQPAEAVSHE